MKYQKINVSICLKYRLSKIHENIHYGFKKQTKVLRLKEECAGEKHCWSRKRALVVLFRKIIVIIMACFKSQDSVAQASIGLATTVLKGSYKNTQEWHLSLLPG